MLSYLPLNEPSWLSGAPEPNPRHKSGTCRECDTTHYNGPDEGIEMSPCSCGTAMCCECCERCIECGEHVCPQCPIEFSSSVKGETELVCSGCHQTYLDEVADGDQIDPIEGTRIAASNTHVEPVMAGILDAFRNGLLGQTGGRS